MYQIQQAAELAAIETLVRTARSLSGTPAGTLEWCGHARAERLISGRMSILKLNHANLCTSDVAALKDILTQHFAFAVVAAGKVPQTGADYAMLRGSDGFSVVITHIGPDSSQVYPTNFHIGFMVATSEEVYAKHRELCESGHHPDSIHTFDALGTTWTAFYFPVGDGFAIEVNHHTE